MKMALVILGGNVGDFYSFIDIFPFIDFDEVVYSIFTDFYLTV